VVVTPDLQRMRRVQDAPHLQQFLAGIFSHRRQTLANALKHHLKARWTPALKDALVPFDLTKRPEVFPVAELLDLAARCSDPAPSASL